MRGTLKFDLKKNRLVMNATFAKYAEICTNPEFKHLMEVKAMFPDFIIITEKINTNPNRVEYEGLTYDFMKWYIREYSETDEIRDENSEKIESAINLIGHQRGGYGQIKSWFLYMYPEIKDNGVTSELRALHFDSTLKSESEEVESDTILQPTLAKTA